MKTFLAITLAVACLVAGTMAQEGSQVLGGQQPFVSADFAQLNPAEDGDSVRNKRQYGFGGGYGGGRGYGGYGGGRGFGGGYRGGYGGGGFGGGGFGGGYGGYGR